MADYAIGAQFKATEPITFDMLYSDHTNYPIKNDWLFWQELTKRTNVTITPSVVPASDYNQKRGWWSVRATRRSSSRGLRRA